MSEMILEQRANAEAVRIHLRPALEMTDEQFFALCQINRDLRIERTAQGDLIVMPPTGWMTGVRNAEITTQLKTWSKRDGRGIATDSSTGFKLPNGADRSPDAAWVLRTRLADLTPEQKRKFLPLCPDFIIELRSPTDGLPDIKAKMDEYFTNGAQLGWLIDPEEKRIHIYRPSVTPEILDNPASVSADTVLTGFTLDLGEIWEPSI